MKLVRGAPGTGKTAMVFRQFKEALRAGSSGLRLVVPTATLVRHFQHELARDGVVFSPRSIVSLNRFILERAALQQSDARQIPDCLRRVLVSGALGRLKFPEFAAVENTEGMAATIAETIDLLENAGCTPEKLALVRKLGPHARLFEKVWRGVNEATAACGYLSRAGMIRLAAASQSPARIWPARIWMDGFVNLSPIEQEFVRTLAGACDLTLTIGDSPAADDIRKFALQLGAEDRLLTGAPRKPATTLINARTLEREADEIARRILALHDQGTAFRDMGVALRDAAVYVPLLQGTFERFGIPARFYFGRPLARHPAAIFLGGLITNCFDGWDFERTITALRAHPRWAARADFDRFEFAVSEAMPGRGAAELLKLCEAAWLREEIDECLKIEAWNALEQTPAEWLGRLQTLAEKIYRPGLLEIARDHAGIEAARSHVAALSAWVAAIAPVASLPARKISLDNFWRAASIAVDAAVLHPMDDRADVVHIMSLYEARQWNIASLFVCGMTDRDFPRQHAQNLLFPEPDIERLRNAGVPARRAADHEREERWLFESLKTRASANLVFTWPDRDATGKSVPCSRLLISEFPDLEQAAQKPVPCTPVPLVAAPGSNTSGRIDSPALQIEMARLHEAISLTALEDLAQCRFKFFGGRTLALKGAPERAGERLQPRVTGLILHTALERWLADRGQDFVRIFEDAFDEACRAQHLPAGYRLEVERIQFREIAQRVSANDLWMPDSSQAEVPILMEFPGGIKVKGRIDRIDTFGGDCVIVDYKSSKTANVQKLVASHTRLQGPLYALAVRESMNLNPVAMIYWAVREDERYGWGKIPGADLEFQPMPADWATAAKARTVERLAGFLAGHVHAHPEETDQCRWCDFAAACRVEQQTLITIGAQSA